MRQRPAMDGHIMLLTMGGTIDADHKQTVDIDVDGVPMTQVGFDGTSRVAAYMEVRAAALGLTFKHFAICQKDSKQIDEDDIRMAVGILKAAEAFAELHGIAYGIPLSCGTDAMTAIAESVDKHGLLQRNELRPLGSMKELSWDDGKAPIGHVPKRPASLGWKAMENGLTLPLRPGSITSCVDDGYGPAVGPDAAYKDYEGRRYVFPTQQHAEYSAERSAPVMRP